MMATRASQDIFLPDMSGPYCPSGGYSWALAKDIPQVLISVFFQNSFSHLQIPVCKCGTHEEAGPCLLQTLISNTVHVPCVGRKSRSKWEGWFAACCYHIFVSSHSTWGHSTWVWGTAARWGPCWGTSAELEQAKGITVSMHVLWGVCPHQLQPLICTQISLSRELICSIAKTRCKV